MPVTLVIFDEAVRLGGRLTGPQFIGRNFKPKLTTDGSGSSRD